MSGPGRSRRRSTPAPSGPAPSSDNPALAPSVDGGVALGPDEGEQTPVLAAVAAGGLLPMDQEGVLLPMDGSPRNSELDLLPMDGSAGSAETDLLPMEEPRGFHGDLDRGVGYDGETLDVDARRQNDDGVVDIGVDGETTQFDSELRGSGRQEGRGSLDLELRHDGDADVRMGADGGYTHGTGHAHGGVDTQVVTEDGTTIAGRASGDARLDGENEGGGGALTGRVTQADGSELGGRLAGGHRDGRTRGELALDDGEGGTSVVLAGEGSDQDGGGSIGMEAGEVRLGAQGEGSGTHGRGSGHLHVGQVEGELGGGHDRADGGAITDGHGRIRVGGTEGSLQGSGGTTPEGHSVGEGSAELTRGEGEQQERFVVEGQGQGGPDAGGSGAIEMQQRGDGSGTHVRLAGAGSGEGGQGQLDIERTDGERTLGGRAHGRNDERGVGGGGGFTMQQGGVRVDADGSHLDGDETDTTTGEVTVRAPGETPQAGDEWKARVKGELVQHQPDGATDVHMEAEGQVADTRGEVTVDRDGGEVDITRVDIVFEQQGIDLGALREAGLCLKGSVEVGPDETHWESSATFTVSRGGRNELTVTVRGGQGSELTLAGETGANRFDADRDQTVAFGEANVVVGEGEGATSIRIIGGGSEGDFALAGSILTNIGDVDIEVAGRLSQEDEQFRKYLEAMVRWRDAHHMVALGGSVTVTPEDEGYRELYELSAEYGYRFREGQEITLKVGVSGASGEPVVFAAEVAYQHNKWEVTLRAVMDSEGDVRELSAIGGYGDVHGGVIHQPGGGFDGIDDSISREVGGDTVFVIGTGF